MKRLRLGDLPVLWEDDIPPCKKSSAQQQLGLDLSGFTAPDVEYDTYAERVAVKSMLLQQLDSNGVEKHLLVIADELVDLDKVNSELNLKSSVLEDLRENYPKDISQQRYQLLRTWKRENGIHATYERLLKAFVSTGSNSAAAEAVVKCLNASDTCDGNDEQSVDDFAATPSLPTCKLHDEEAKRFYCLDCSTLICSQCTQLSHRHHHFKSAPDIKHCLTEELQSLKRSLAHSLQQIECMETDFKIQSNSMRREIDKEFEKLESIVKKHRQELLKEAETQVSKKLERLFEQKKVVSSSLQVASDCAKKCERTDEEVLSMYTEIRHDVDRKIVKKNLDPVVEPDIELEINCSEDVKQICHTKAKIVPLAVTYTTFGISTSEVNETSEFKLIAKLSNGKPSKQSRDVECQLKRLDCGTITECKVVDVVNGEYRIQYRPTAPGKHELTVTVNGEDIDGSPFPLWADNFLRIPSLDLELYGGR